MNNVREHWTDAQRSEQTLGSKRSGTSVHEHVRDWTEHVHEHVQIQSEHVQKSLNTEHVQIRNMFRKILTHSERSESLGVDAQSLDAPVV